MSLEPKLEILSAAQRILWLELATVPDTFVLYGGTGLALRLGHRVSVDFDFFSSEPFKRTMCLSREHAHRVHRPWGPR